jgi:hypothetical protein
VVVDLLRDLVPARVIVPLAIAVNAVGAVAMLAMGWESIQTSMVYMLTGETPMTVLVPKYPFIWIAAFGSFTYAGVLLFKTFRPDERHEPGGSSR